MCVLVMVRSMGSLKIVKSLAVSLARFTSPPPETVAVLVTLSRGTAAAETVTVNAIGW